MTELTRDKITLVMLAIQALRLKGRIGEDEPMSLNSMAGYAKKLGCPLSEKTFHHKELEELRLARLALDAKLSTEEKSLLHTWLRGASSSSPMTNDR